MNKYRLISDGDLIEKECWNLFVGNEFSTYEIFWIDYIVPLTNRPSDIHFKTNQELIQIGKSEKDICIAQLNYSILRHLKVVYELKELTQIDLDKLTEGMVRICGALDNAFELLERYSNPIYNAWVNGKLARRNWQNKNNHPLQQLRDYRNHLIHGRLTPSDESSVQLLVPNFGSEEKYYDWRLITNPTKNPGLNSADLKSSNEILNQAWQDAIIYLESNWKTVLMNGKIYPNLPQINVTSKTTNSISGSNVSQSSTPKSGSVP